MNNRITHKGTIEILEGSLPQDYPKPNPPILPGYKRISVHIKVSRFNSILEYEIIDEAAPFYPR